jgi:hypothetical protein
MRTIRKLSALCAVALLCEMAGHSPIGVAMAQQQCGQCVNSRMTIYRDTNEQATGYCRKIGMCPGGPANPAGPPAPAVVAPVAPAPVAAPAAAPLRRPVPQAAAANGPPPNGTYECWFFGQQQGGLNFTLTGGGGYADAAGGTGTVSISGTGMSFTGAGLDGQTGEYQGGNPPTVSLSGARKDEASCQLKR